jgi:hypothetical protein
VHDSVEAYGGVSEGGQCAHDQQVGEVEGLGVEEVVEQRKVDSGELESQRGGDGGKQGGVGQGAGADPGAGGDRELGRAEREEGHALPGPAGGVAPHSHAEGHRGDDRADSGDALPQPGPEHAFGGRAGRAAHRARLRRFAAQGDAGQAVGEQVHPQDLGGQQGQGEAEEGPDEHDRDLSAAAG